MNRQGRVVRVLAQAVCADGAIPRRPRIAILRTWVPRLGAPATFGAVGRGSFFTLEVVVLSFARSTLSFFTGNVAYVLSQFLMLVAATRLSSTSEVGRYALALAIVGPVFSLSSLKLREVHISDASSFFSVSVYYRTRFATSVLALAACGALLFALDRRSILTVVAVAVFKAIEAQLEIAYGTFQRHGLVRVVASLQVGRGIFGLVFFCAALMVRDEVWLAVLASTLPSLVAMTWAVSKGRAMDRGRECRRSGEMRALMVQCAPLGISVALGALAVSVPRFFLQGYSTPADVGVFAALTYVLMGPSTAVTAISEIAMPRLADESLRGNSRAFTRMVSRLMLAGAGIGVLCTAGAFVLGQWTLGVVFGSEYAKSWTALVILMCGSIFQYSSLFVGTAAQALQMFKVQVPINLIYLGILSLGCYLMIPVGGVVGAALAVGAAQLALLLMYLYLYRSRIRFAVRASVPSLRGETEN